MSNIGTKTYKAKIGLSDIERQKFNDDAVNEANRVANEYIEENTQRTETALAGIEDFGGRLATAEEKVDRKLDKDGYSGLAHVGLADNIASPDGVVNDEPYTFRPTAGETSVSDGYAEIKEIRGNSIKRPIRATVDLGTLDWNKGSEDRYFAFIENILVPTSNQIPANIYCSKYPTQSADYRETHKTENCIYMNNGGRTLYIQDLTGYADANAFKASVSGVMLEYDTPENEIVHSNITGVKSVGFNAFDGELVGGYISGDGNVVAQENGSKSSANLIPVVCGEEYTLTVDKSWKQKYIAEYDKYGHFIQKRYLTQAITSLTLTDNTYFARIQFLTEPYDETAKACFHLTHSGYRNGQYEPHWSEERHIDTTKYFPDGMKSAGTAADLLTPKKARKVIDEVDLGTLNWYIDSNNRWYSGNLLGKIKPASSTEKANIICSKYMTDTQYNMNQNVNDKTIGTYQNGNIAIYDTSLPTDGSITAEQVKALLSGVYLVYELATPVETDVEQTRANDWFYRESDFGTEEQLVVDGFAPAVIETFYMNNLRDKLRNLPEIPKCEDTTGTSVLKCINGTLTWVKEIATTEE